MANVVLPKAKQNFLLGDIHFDTDTIKVALVDTGTVAYSAAHDYYNDISAGVVGTPVALTSKTVTDGVFDSADPTWAGVSGATCEAIVMYMDSGDPATSPVIGWWDTLTGLALTPNGGDVTYTVHANGWFGL
jgi:hypothetical protein